MGLFPRAGSSYFAPSSRTRPPHSLSLYLLRRIFPQFHVGDFSSSLLVLLGFVLPISPSLLLELSNFFSHILPPPFAHPLELLPLPYFFFAVPKSCSSTLSSPPVFSFQTPQICQSSIAMRRPPLFFFLMLSILSHFFVSPSLSPLSNIPSTPTTPYLYFSPHQ